MTQEQLDDFLNQNVQLRRREILDIITAYVCVYSDEYLSNSETIRSEIAKDFIQNFDDMTQNITVNNYKC